MLNRLLLLLVATTLIVGEAYATLCTDIFPGPQTFTTNSVDSIEGGVTCNGTTCSPGSFTAASPYPSFSSTGNFSSSTIVGGTTYAHNNWKTSGNQTVSYTGTGTTIIYIKNNATIKKGVKINVGGNPANVLMIFNKTLKIEEGAVINAFIYVNGSETTIEKNSTIEGGIAARTKLILKENSTYTYTPADANNIEASSFCDGSAPSVHHYEIEHDISGSICINELVTVKACTNTSCSALSTDSVNLEFQIDGASETSLTFTGSTTFDIAHLVAETVTFSLTSESIVPDNALVCDDGSGSSCDMVFTSTNCQAFSHWQMEQGIWNGTAGEVLDSSANAYHGTAVNGAVTDNTSPAKSGDPGTCNYGVFDDAGGSNGDYVEIAGFPNLTTDFTMTAWVRSEDRTRHGQRIFADDQSNSQGYAVSIGDPGTGRVRFYSRGVSPVNLDTPVVINNNTWYFVAGVADITNKQRTLYIFASDGTLLNTTQASYTGTWGLDAGPASIGGETNSGETDNRFKGNVDEVRIYSGALSQDYISSILTQTHPCSVSSGIDHYEITHDGSGLTCDSESVTIKACLNSDCSSLSSDSVTLDFQADGVTKNSPTFTGSTSFNFTHTSAETLTLSVANETSSAGNALVCVNSSGGASCDIDFATAGFRFLYGVGNSTTVGNQVAGNNFADILKLQAVKDSNGVCTGLFTGNVNVDLAQQNLSPSGTGGLSFTVNGSAIAKHSTFTPNVSLNFGSNSIATIPAPIYQDAGQIQLHARYNLGGVALSGNSNSFWVSPVKLVVTAKTSGGSDINNATSGAGATHKAGDSFVFEVKAVNASGTPTPNYQSGQIQFLLDRTGPTASGSDGSFTYASAGGSNIISALSPSYQNVTLESFSSGVSTFNAANYSEVGLLNLDLQDSSYGGAGITVSGDAINIGRFIPDHFTVTASNGTFDDACGSFSYLGQSFSYGAASIPSITLTAKNAASPAVTTGNYTETGYLKLLGTNVTRVFPNQDNTQNGKDALTRLHLTSTPNTGAVSVGASAGEVAFTFNSADSYQYTKNINSEVGNFTSALTIWATAIQDSDGVAVPVADLPVSMTPTGTDIRYGRFVVENAFGPETDDLAMGAYSEFLNGLGEYALNTSDNCTNLLSTVSLSPQGTSGSENHDAIPVSSGTSDFSYNSTFISGEAGFLFTAPSAGNDGEIDVSIDLLALPWLQYDWDGNGALQNPPSATASFGQYRGHDRIIYWREVQ